MTGTMSKAATEELQNLMFRHVLAEGEIVRPDASYYGWTDYNMTMHAQSCRVILGKNPKLVETIIGEFQGTFYEGDTSVAVLQIDGVSCACGKIKNRMIRSTGSIGELMFSLFNNLPAVIREDG